MIEDVLSKDRVAQLGQAIRQGHIAYGCRVRDKRAQRMRETLLALISDWERLKEAPVPRRPFVDEQAAEYLAVCHKRTGRPYGI